MIKDLKELKQFLKICRDNGVESIKFGNTEVYLKPQAAKSKAKNSILTGMDIPDIPKPTYVPGGIDEDVKIQTPDELTEEQLLFYSASGESAAQ
jgi:hypothetical protein